LRGVDPAKDRDVFDDALLTAAEKSPICDPGGRTVVCDGRTRSPAPEEPTMRPVLKLSAAVLALSVAFAAPAFAADQPQDQIAAFDNTLISVMKNAKSLGFQGRYAELKRAVEQTLDIPTMSRIAVGPAWVGMTEAQRDAIIQAFTRLTVASYAHNFDGWNGERFDLAPNVEARGQDKIVQTKIVSKGGDAVILAYRMRQTPGGAWKVIDIYYNGSISELTTRRSDFQATLAAGGPKALAEHLNAQAEKLSR
jgi:phospholipid transport system substrate-binding protein